MMPDWILLLPILLPILGALLFSEIARRFSAKSRLWLSMIFLSLLIVAILLNIAPGSHRLVLNNWQPAAFMLALQIDGVTLILLLTMVVPLAALWLVALPRRPFDPLPMLVVSSAILLAAHDNLLTAYLAGALLDLSVFAWRIARNIERETIVRGLVIGLFSGMILIAGAIYLTSQPTIGALLITLAFWARLGLYPFHYLLPTRGADTFDLWIARGVPVLAASSLWLRWSTLRVEAPITLIGVLSGVALLVYALWVWREESPARVVGTSISNAFVLVPLTITFGGTASVALSLWLALAAAIALALFELALQWRADNSNRWHRLAWFTALFTFAGIPLTPAFLGRLGAYVALWASGNGGLMLIAGAAIAITLIPLWNIGFALHGDEKRAPTRIEFAGLGLILVAFIALALAPMLIASALAPAVGESAERALDLVVRTDNVAGVGASILILIVPIIAAYLINPLIIQLRPRPDSLLVRLARLITLDWLERLIVALGYQVSRLARNTATIAEENPTVWLLFVALWVAIFIMIVR